jgi:hypothetical protein
MRKTTGDADRVVALIAERSAYWTSQGCVGAQLYERLASDNELPENLDSKVIAAIENKQPSAVAQERKRGSGASYLRLAQNFVVYPRAAYFQHLRDRFVERRPALDRATATASV